MRKLNSAVVGCGAIFENHALGINNLKNANLYAVCDTNIERLNEKAEKYNCKAFSSFDELIRDEEVDVIHICTPHYLHVPMAIEAMKNGKHVLLEKPMALDAQQAQQLVDCEEKYKVSLGICFQNRFNSTNIRVKELIESGCLGKIYSVKATLYWHRDEEYYLKSDWRGRWATEGGGLLINQAIHTLDLLMWFFGDVEKVEATVSNHKLKNIIEVEDTSEAYIKFKNGVEGYFYGTNTYPINEAVSIEIVSENANIKLQERLEVIYNNGSKETLEEVRKKGEKGYWGLSHGKLIEKFYSCINHKKFEICPEEGIKSLQFIEKIRESSNKK